MGKKARQAAKQRKVDVEIERERNALSPFERDRLFAKRKQRAENRQTMIAKKETIYRRKLHTIIGVMRLIPVPITTIQSVMVFMCGFTIKQIKHGDHLTQCDYLALSQFPVRWTQITGKVHNQPTIQYMCYRAPSCKFRDNCYQCMYTCTKSNCIDEDCVTYRDARNIYLMSNEYITRNAN
jgi:hypothetical protein